MIDAGTMIARLPDDVRGRLRGAPDDLRLRHMAWLFVESGGDVCPAQAMDEAIDVWIACGAPDPERFARCPMCDYDLTLSGDELFTCTKCDITLGASWNTNPDIKGSRFTLRELSGHSNSWPQRPIRWNVNGPFDAQRSVTCAG